MGTTGDKMTFVERLKNVVALVISRTIVAYLNNNEVTVLRKKYATFKDSTELIAQSSFIFTNSNPYLDYPRPTLHKTITIGGFAVTRSLKEAHALDEEWNSVLNARPRTVLVSFGSVTKSIYMPENFKKTLLDVFASMPETTFVWKYEDLTNITITESHPNVFLSEWVPQIPLLKDERLTAFITHGGIGSTNEVAFTGKPAIVVPIFGDQMRNSHMLAKHGGALLLEKSELGDFNKLRNALQEVLDNPSYAKNAMLLSQILHNQPISPQELLLRHAEFAARFGQIPNLDSYGRHLSLVQYYSIDIVATLIAVPILFLVFSAFIVRKCFWRRVTKLKPE
ncbi:glycosyltransferase family 28 protein [Necator americanus]|uniref:glucuronosyltransferase n=1 Tax=Necator americanus TaxID=51031 RepID=W2SWE5_NECAM|nr:glycosyltransferase family 28 protein [Necator americanus]ETN73818.1 glycosyltransferase family 28 protein [Necator americanus]